MKKSLILASLLFSASLTAETVTATNGLCYEVTRGESSDCLFPRGMSAGQVYDFGYPGASSICQGNHYLMGLKYNYSSTADRWYSKKVSPTTCPPKYSDFTNDPEGCNNFGGYYFNDGSCLNGPDAIAKVFTDPLAVTGTFLTINGLTWTAAGLLLAATPIGGATALTWGAYATLAGIGSIAVSAASQMYSSSDSSSPTNDVTLSDGTRLKVSTDQYDNTQVVKANTTTGKIDSISTIPPEVAQRMSRPVNTSTGQPSTPFVPSDFAGVKTTSYDYSSNTATTQTVQTDGSIKTETTPITTVQNSNGSVTTTSQNNTIAPTVTGTKGSTIDVPEWNQYTTIAQWTETTADNTGGTTGSTNTGGGSSGGTSTGTDPDTGDETFGVLTLDDGSGNFGSFTDQITDSFKNYVYSKPLNITCSNTLSIDPIYFDLMGRRFTLLDNAMLSHVPAELFRTILLFVAAVSATILIFVGGI
jgi:hypothetical protein